MVVMVKTLKNLLLTDFNDTLYVASVTLDNHDLYTS